MSIRRSAEEAGWRLRVAGEEAGWSAREVAWSLEERVLWPGSDAARRALARALQALEPLGRLIQTKLVWPLSDRLDDYGTAGRTAMATVTIAAAAAAGLAGSQLAASEPGVETPAEVLASTAPVAATSSSSSTLSGVAPDFERTAAASAKAVPTTAAAAPKKAPAQVAWRFAEAFASYEVGRADEETAATFSELADETLAEALGTEPPRLPESAKVPEAKVLNVVLGERKGAELQASVSLLRLEAASELRLTLRRGEEGWRVAEVRG